MKILLIILTFLTMSSSCSNENRTSSKISLTYKQWQESVIKAVNEEKDLLVYQKVNIIEVAKTVTENKFIELKNKILRGNNDNVNLEYYIMNLSEGEVVTANLYFIKEVSGKYDISVMNLYDEDIEVKRLNESSSYVKKLLNVPPMGNDYLNQNLYVLTSVENNNVNTNIGNGD